jgi:hypothetical protein
MEKLKIEHNGVNYEHFRSDIVAAGAVSIEDKKFIINGIPKMTITTNSYKYDSELQISLICRKGEAIEKIRNPSNWNTIEINFPIEEGKAIIEEMYKRLFPEKQEIKN